MAAFGDLVRFNPTLGGTTDWIFSTIVAGCQSPASAGLTNGVKYKIYAVSNDLTQWEISEGAYNSSTTTFPRTTVLYNSSATGTATGQSGAGTKITFSTVPQVAVVGLAEDLLSIEVANSFTAAQKAQAIANLKIGAITTQSLTSGSSATYTTGTQSGVRASWIEVFMVGGGGGGCGFNAGTAGTTVSGSDGTASIFNSVNANPGKGAVGNSIATAGSVGGAGGFSGTGSATRRGRGGPGVGGMSTISSNPVGYTQGGMGGNSYFAGGAQVSGGAGTSNGNAADANSGAGGSGSSGGAGPNSNISMGAGGGAGEFVYIIIDNPVATYTYTIGSGGAGGIGLNSTGGAGGSGFAFIVEHYGLP